MAKKRDSLAIAAYEAWLPSKVQKTIRKEVGKVALRFRLDAEKREDLVSYVRCEVIEALRTKYDPNRAAVGAFAYKVTRNCLCVWMDRETKRRNRFVEMTPELEERIEKMPVTASAHDAALLRIALVRQTVAALPPLYRRVCELYMKLGTLEKVQQALHKSPRDFYNVIWPRCQDAFKKIFEKSGSDFASC